MRFTFIRILAVLTFFATITPSRTTTAIQTSRIPLFSTVPEKYIRVESTKILDFFPLLPLMYDPSKRMICSLVWDPLVMTNSYGEFRPLLLNSIKPSADGKRYELYINPAATWSDGTKITAEDIAETLRLVRDITVKGLLSGTLDSVYDITFSSERVVLSLKEARMDVLANLALYPPMQYRENSLFFERCKSALNTFDLYATIREQYQSTLPVTSGPYKLERRGHIIVLSKNPRYVGKMPGIADGFVFVQMNDDPQQLTANPINIEHLDDVSHIDVAFMSWKERFAFTRFNRYKDVRQDFVIRTFLDYSSDTLFFNLAKEPTNDLAVRQALAHLMPWPNPDELSPNSTIRMVIPQSPLHPDSPFYRPLPNYRRPNRETAVFLLEKAGWKLKSGGIRYKDGKRLRIEVLDTGGETLTNPMVLLRREAYKAGIEIYTVHTNTDNLTDNLTKRIANGWFGNEAWDPTSPVHQFDFLLPTSPINYLGYNSDEYTRVYALLMREPDYEKQVMLTTKLCSIINQDLPFVVYLHSVRSMAFRKRIDTSSTPIISSLRLKFNLSVRNWKKN